MQEMMRKLKEMNGNNQSLKGEENINPDEPKKENLTPPDNLDMR